jgi:restriction endonuclease S subunit
MSAHGHAFFQLTLKQQSIFKLILFWELSQPSQRNSTRDELPEPWQKVHRRNLEVSGAQL